MKVLLVAWFVPANNQSGWGRAAALVAKERPEDVKGLVACWSMRANRVRIAIALLLGTTLAAQAHSWYPIECCKSKEEDGDCRPVPCDELLQRSGGGVDYRAPEGSKIYVAPSLVYPSPDSKCHICYEPRGKGGAGFCAWLQYGN